jgi:hypothetical protein
MKDQQDITFFLNTIMSIFELIMQAFNIADMFFGLIGVIQEMFFSGE